MFNKLRFLIYKKKKINNKSRELNEIIANNDTRNAIVEFNIIDVYIYDNVNIYKNLNFNLDASQKFGSLYVNKNKKGIIHPNTFKYGKYVKEFKFNKKYVRENGRLYTSNILTTSNTASNTSSNTSSITRSTTNFNKSSNTSSNTSSTINHNNLTTISNINSIKNLSSVNIQNFYKLYLNQRTKQLKISNTKFYTLERLKDIVDTIGNASIKMETYIKNNIKTNLTKLTKIKYILNNAFIFNIDYSNHKDKVVIFGDFHGSFHTFYRIFLRLHSLGIIDFDKYIINDNYKLIFLGDIADRGQYALEIYYIISKFINNNNSDTELKIILNRGNHEDPHQWIGEKQHEYSFLNELNKKFKNVKQKDEIINNITKLISYCPSAIILKYNGSKYWLSHGGILDPYTDLKKYNISDESNKVIFFDNKEISFNIRWSDYSLDFNNLKENKPTGRKVIGKKYFLDFLKNYDIQFIIRGHTDNYENAYLLSDNLKKPNYNYYINNILALNNLKIQEANQNNQFILFPKKKEIFNNPLIEKVKQCHGPISQIIPNNWINDENESVVKINDFKESVSKYYSNQPKQIINNHTTVYPVLTISTNSDIGRSLNNDSFIILKHSYPKNIENFNINKSKKIINHIKKTKSINNQVKS